MSDGGIADDLAALSLDENGVAWGQGNSPSARRRRRNREAREAREPSVISQADTVTPAVEADDDRSSILSYPTDASDAASVTDLHFGPAADGGRWDLAGQFFNADGVRQAGITKLLVLQCIIAEFGAPFWVISKRNYPR